jgi:hypothetical protein
MCHRWHSWWRWSLLEERARELVVEVLTEEVRIADVR